MSILYFEYEGNTPETFNEINKVLNINKFYILGSGYKGRIIRLIKGYKEIPLCFDVAFEEGSRIIQKIMPWKNIITLPG